MSSPRSNPVVSFAPISGVPGILDALRTTAAPIVGVCPIVGGAPVRGMADACLTAIGVAPSAAGVATHYGARSDGGLLDAWIVDDADRESVEDIAALGIRAVATDTIFSNPGVGERVADLALTLGAESR